MIWNWQQPDWPNRHLDSEVRTFGSAIFIGFRGLLGAWKHLQSETQEQVKIDLLSDEAMKTSEIEGEFLDRDSVQSSIRRQFDLTADRRSGPAETGIARLVIACFQDFKAPLTDSMLFNWHELVCAGCTDLKMIAAFRDLLDRINLEFFCEIRSCY